MFALKIYKLAAEHHCHLLFTVRLEMLEQVVSPTSQGIDELVTFLKWFLYVPYRYLNLLLKQDED